MGNEASTATFEHYNDLPNNNCQQLLQQIARLQAEQNQLVQQQIRNLQNEITTKGNEITTKENFGHVQTENYRKKKISKEELSQARKRWGDALVAISIANDQQGLLAATEIAKKVIDYEYGYNFGPVLFKPTLTSGDHTFRTTRDGALSYFVGQNPRYPNDSGFALKGWRKADIETAAEFIDDDVGMWMGIVTLTDKNGNKVKVDKSWGYKKDKDGRLRIVLHHSSLPYIP